MTYLQDADYFVRLVALPYQIHGMTVTNDDSTFSIYINSRSTHEQQVSAYFHEVAHIKNDDFYSGLPIEQIEHL